MTDAKIIARSADEPEAFMQIFERHFGAVHQYVSRRGGIDLADDLAAETLVRAFERRTRYRPLAPTALPWLLGIATNLLADHRRAEQRQWRAYAAAAATPVPGQNGSVLIRGSEEQGCPQLAAALEQLSPEDRDTLLLYAWAELGYAEIAAALDVPVGTVRSRLHRARNVLRGLLESSVAEPQVVAAGRKHTAIGGEEHER